MSLKFVDNFWMSDDDDFVSTAGFDVIWKRMKCSHKMGKDIEEYLKSLAKIEIEYSKSLSRLNKSAEKEDLGKISQAWQEFKLQMEHVASNHEEVSHILNNQVESLRLNNDKHEERRKMKDSLKKCQTAKSTTYTRTLTAEKNYSQKCKEKEQLKKQYELTKMTTAANKETEKLFNKYQKAIQTTDQADCAYKTSIDQLEEQRKQWEKEMTNACVTFQRDEEERIHFERELLWIVCNARSQACVDDDKAYENIRQQLELCDIQDDIRDFINNNRTGHIRPAPILYNEYDESRKKVIRHPVTPHNGTRAQRQQMPKPDEMNSSTAIYSTIDI